MNDICCIGHITLDKIITPKQTIYMPGGTSYYFSHGISHLNDWKNYKLVTSLAPSEYSSVDELTGKGLNVEIIPINLEKMEDIPLLESRLKGTLLLAPNELYEGFFVAKLRKKG